jgi:hypothetical protein
MERATDLFLCSTGNARIGEMGYGKLRPDTDKGAWAFAFRATAVQHVVARLPAVTPRPNGKK